METLRGDELPSAFLASASQPEHPCMRDMGVSMLLRTKIRCHQERKNFQPSPTTNLQRYETSHLPLH